MPGNTLHNASRSPSSHREEGLPFVATDSCPVASESANQVSSRQGRVVGRFAPTPSGKLHLGNLFSFLVAYIVARRENGSVLMRIEDLDPARSKQSYADAVFRDLDALGFEWDNKPVYQSARTDAYIEAFRKLESGGLLYPCFCSRADLHSANAPHFGEEVVYAGTCRNLSDSERHEKASHRNPATRIVVLDEPIAFHDIFQGAQSFNLAECSGDFILRRSDGVFAYQLAVVVDDAWMGVTSVVRGCDLITSTPRQMYLQHLLGFDIPSYGHVPLIVDEQGRRLSKRDKSTDIDFLLNEQGVTTELLLGKVAFHTGLIDEDVPIQLDELVKTANLSALKGKSRIEIPLGCLL